jgi:subtilisin family serine protease
MLALLTTLIASTGWRTPSSAAATGKLDSALVQRLQQGGLATALIILTQQADTSFAAAMASKSAKGRAVVAALRAQADRDQPALLAALAARGVAAQRFFSVNALSAEIDLATAQLLAGRADVAQVLLDQAAQRVEPAAPAAPSIQSPATTEWGLDYVKAPQVWALGYTGQGIVVAGEDTGVRWTHTSLKAGYRGWNGTVADHNYSWHDAIHSDIGTPNPEVECGFNSPVPCDDYFHGTHTVGTMVGVDGAQHTGVAPGATWIACRNMDNGDGSNTTYIECIDWMLAPYPLGGSPAQGDSDRAPDIINNSWGCPASEGCDTSNFALLQTAIRNVTNAGILFVSSAGNAGSGCSTITTPAALFPESFVVGAHDAQGGIAGFSSRGPVVYAATSRIGPDITAPGVAVYAASNSGDSDYTTAQGTSMAAPHVAGVAALLWSARPELRGQVDLTRRILQETATPATSAQTCGGVLGSSVPNNTFGHGRVDALAAIQPTLQGSVTVNGTAAPTATLTISAPTLQLISTTGAYSTTLPTGSYTVTAQVANFPPQSFQVSIAAHSVTTRNFMFGESFGSLVYLPLLSKQ